MTVSNQTLVRGALILLAAAALAACSSVDDSARRLATAITPYKATVVQGNFVSREQVEALQPGMSRQQVRDILGTPLVTDLFHANRWEYVFTIKRPGEDRQTRKLSVFFDGDLFARAEGDAMPTEAEFVASLGVQTRKKGIPPLEATEAQLARYPAPSAPSDTGVPDDAAASASGTEPASYPPLESPVR
jgi:outer membrane protein assembly factor BamE